MNLSATVDSVLTVLRPVSPPLAPVNTEQPALWEVTKQVLTPSDSASATSSHGPPCLRRTTQFSRWLRSKAPARLSPSDAALVHCSSKSCLLGQHPTARSMGSALFLRRLAGRRPVRLPPCGKSRGARGIKHAGVGGRVLLTPRGQRRPRAVRPVRQRVQQWPLHTGAHAPRGKGVRPC